ncbi:hypothetical protein [Halomarina ordinaria]|uniref:Transposase n=1 Tax=Halomarina ordinaria TaxID=3033939 RepID=A0ABD5U7U0_9EURY|nr:hypothetical protein [Halomarina sp. PSRA2]
MSEIVQYLLALSNRRSTNDVRWAARRFRVALAAWSGDARRYARAVLRGTDRTGATDH